MSGTRKLAAILAADVVGYSRLMGEDEAGTAKIVREQREAATPIVRLFGGRLVKTMGDGVLLEFPSVVAAVECAIAIQKMMADRNAAVPEAKRILYRVGVNLGDILIEGEDILGDGVNVAARLEGICEPGGICLSEDAYRQARGRIEAEFVDLGEQALKNIARPVRAYVVTPKAIAAAKVEPAETSASAGQSRAPERREPPRLPEPSAPKKRAALALLAAALAACVIAYGAWWFLIANRPASVTTKVPAEAAHLSIVVLPFVNLSGDPSQDYFADGITENLTTDLSRLSGSFVIARNTAFTFKGKNADAKEIGKELGVRYVLEGSVQRDQNQVRVNAQLIDAETGGHLWAERFDKPLADLFGMQDEIVASLASQLGGELMRSEARRAERTPNPDSMDLYFQGTAWFNKGRNVENMAHARSFFQRALVLDPDNLDALLGAAAADVHTALGYNVDNKAERLVAIEANLNRVLSQSPSNALAHYLMCRVEVQSNRGAQGIAECERALALNPNLAAAHAQIGIAKMIDGHPEETERHVREALRVSPHDTDAYDWVAYIAYAKQRLGAYEDALGFFRQSIELNPNYATARFLMAGDLVELGRLDEARAEVQAGLALNPGFTIRRYRAGAQSDNADFLKGRERIIEDMRKAGVPEG
jgi:TolB-like protein/class 3 adenylate cyclase/cytochrome c-type biogenesis protein CcmH/NrfG